MANKGTGVGVCHVGHGEYHLDAPDSPCPTCEDGVQPERTSTFATPKDALAAVVAITMQSLREGGVPDLEPTHFNCCHARKDMGHSFGCPNSPENEVPDA